MDLLFNNKNKKSLKCLTHKGVHEKFKNILINTNASHGNIQTYEQGMTTELEESWRVWDLEMGVGK